MAEFNLEKKKQKQKHKTKTKQQQQGRFLSKHGYLQPYFHFKAKRLSTQLQNCVLAALWLFEEEAIGSNIKFDYNRAFSLRGPISMLFNQKKRKRLHKNKVQFPEYLIEDTNMVVVTSRKNPL